jgi:hypothetical protein
MHPASEAACVHPASEATCVHATSEAASVHATSHPAAMHAATTTAKAASGKRRRRKSERHAERSRGEATKELVVHLNPSWSSCIDGYRRRKGDRCRRKKKTTSRAK